MLLFKKYFVFYLIGMISLNVVLAQPANLKPVLYGQAFDGNAPADGAAVIAYPLENASDTLTDTVGPSGKVGLSSYWKANLNGFSTNIQNNDIIVINLTDGIEHTSITYTVNLADGTKFFVLNLDKAFQDYDDDGHFANTDCNDNDDSINPEAEEICSDSIDQDCSGADEECEFSADIILFEGWTSFSLQYNPAGIDNSEELGQAIIASGIDCAVIMKFNGETQLWEDDIFGLPDPSFALSGTEGYFIHCSEPGTFTYGGTLWV